jgi:polysaccharide export outer membrane protein
MQTAALRPSEDTLYRLGPGDKLRVTIFNESDLTGEYAIDGQGFVRLPLVGQVQAAGQTSLSLESRIGDAFVAGGFLLNPRISVEIVTYRPFYIIGEVAKPGEYAYVDAMTVPNAIALAGGYTERAVESTVWIRRLGDKKEHTLRADETTRIHPGDVIRVERTTYWAVMSILSPLISPFATTAYLLK